MKQKVLPIIIILVISFGANLVLAGEKLYNGIELPDKWPPILKAADLVTREVMAVPYLDKPPAVIPIDVGRQLFVDEFLIEKTTLQRTWHKPTYYENNPILFPRERWEKTGGSMGRPEEAFPFHGGVWFDPADSLFKIWYTYGTYSGIALATSKDGIHWDRPSFDIRPGTNIVRVTSSIDSVTIWLDLEEKDPARRFKMYEFDRDCWKGQILFSPDGINWTHNNWTGPTPDGASFFYNPFRKVWVISYRDCMPPKNPPPRPVWGQGTFVYGRARRYLEGKDFVKTSQWTTGPIFQQIDWAEGQPTWWLMTDKNDKPRLNILNLVPELYHVDCVAYESLMLGEFVIWHYHQPGRPKVNEIYYAFSRDGFHFSRGSYEPMMPTSPDKNAWNAGNVQDATGLCCVVGDKLYFYCSGRSSDPNNASNEGQNSTGMAFLRRDGFCSMDGGESNDGTLTTRPVTFNGKYMFVNTNCYHGDLTVEILDKDGKVIEPFSRKNCVPISVDKTLWPVAWKGADDLSKLSGQEVKFKFYLKYGQLYSFWISPDQSGASYGYVAAGGPGFTSNIDTTGSKAYEAAYKIK